MSRQEAAKRSGWKELPSCQYLVPANNGKLYCAYDHESLDRKLSERLSPEMLGDIGMREGLQAGVESGRIAKECAEAECPLRLRHRSKGKS